MTRTDELARQARRAGGRHRIDFDRLEFRLAMTSSAGTLAIAAASAGGPAQVSAAADGSTATTAPATGIAGLVGRSSNQLTYSFSGPIDPFSVGKNDFELLSLPADGTAARPVAIEEAMDTTDPTGSRVVLNPDQPLPAGQYRLLLLGDNMISSLDGTVAAGSGCDLDVADFSIRPRGPSFSDATSLGTATSDVGVKADQLDLATNPGATNLYSITLPDGHFWRLGLEISAQGGSSAPALSLFDATGKLISTASRGSIVTSGDPYLFAGLGAGTYYVGVSGAGGSTGADPAPGQTVGAYRLLYVADPADQATRVLNVRTDRADAESTAPTGLTVQFSGAINADGLDRSALPAAVLVDTQGRSWPITPTAYDPWKAQLSFAFGQAMPSGHYTLKIANQGVLTDLAGLTPVAPGRPSGELGSIDVGRAATTPADDLGTMFPGVGSLATSGPIAIRAGKSAVEHFTVVQSGLYTFQLSDPSVQVHLSATRTELLKPAAVSLSAGTDGYQAYLAEGTYSLILTNGGGNASMVAATIRRASTQAASILEGGVAQGPALGLRSIAPPAIATPSAENASTPGPNSTASTATAQAGATAVATAAGTTTGPTTPSANFFQVGGPVGHPTGATEIAAPAGVASSPSNLATLNERSLPAGPGRALDASDRVARSRTSETSVDLPIGASRPMAEAATSETSSEREELSIAWDRRILDEASWVDDVVTQVLDRFETPAQGNATGTEAAVVSLPPADSEPAGEGQTTQLASIASPIGIGILGMLAVRYRQAKQAGAAASAGPRLGERHPSPLMGPHTRRRTSPRG